MRAFLFHFSTKKKKKKTGLLPKQRLETAASLINHFSSNFPLRVSVANSTFFFLFLSFFHQNRARKVPVLAD